MKINLSFYNTTLLGRLFSGYVVIILMLTIITSTLISRQVTQSSIDDVHRSLAVRAQLIVELVKPYFRENNTNTQEDLQSTITRLVHGTESRLTILQANGTVLADSQQEPAHMDNHLNRPEIVNIKGQGYASSTRFSQTVKKEMVYFAQKVEINGQALGFVRVSLPLSLVDKKLAELRYIILLSAALAGLSALLVGYSFFRHFSLPFKKIAEVAEAIAKGDYSQRITTNQKDEIGELTSSFNRIAQSSENRINEIITERNRLAMIFSGMVEGVIYVNENLEISHINQAAASILGVAELSVNQTTLNRIKNAEINSAVVDAITNKSVVKTKIYNSLQKDSTEIIDVYVASLANDTGDSIGAVIVLNDISELVRLERVRRDFVANASHELKTPITAIRGLTETILDDSDMLPTTRDRFIEKINVQTIRLSDLVSDLISLSRLDIAQKTESTDAFNIVDVAKMSIKSAASLCQQKKLNLSSLLSEEKLKIKGDKQEISQLIDNLLNNAINYTPQFGSINISVDKNDTMVVIKIEDTGIGIAKEFQKRIFERFYRVDSARARDIGGTGLGLSIVKNIVDKNDGTINLVSRENHGSIFTVSFPLFKP
jgi:two-component system phosphate regulon sensor histidine kinase PhoR